MSTNFCIAVSVTAVRCGEKAWIDIFYCRGDLLWFINVEYNHNRKLGRRGNQTRDNLSTLHYSLQWTTENLIMFFWHVTGATYSAANTPVFHATLSSSSSNIYLLIFFLETAKNVWFIHQKININIWVHVKWYLSK